MTSTSPVAWIVYASRTPYALDIAEIIWRHGNEIAYVVDNLPDGPLPSEIGEVCAPAALGPDALGLPTVIPQMTPGHRQTVHVEAIDLGLADFPVLVCPTATIARTAVMGEGTVLNAGVIVAAASTMGAFVQVNRGAAVGHHNVLEDYVSLGPGCTLAGHVRVGRGAFIGTGAVCAPEVSIGANSVVGAGSVVVRDIPANVVAVGNPAKVIREGIAGYGDVGVA